MAIIYSYPVASAVEAGDLVIGTDITGKQTKNFTLQSIVDLIELPDNINGTVGTIPVFTGTKAIGDSIITQDPVFDKISINGSLDVNGSLKMVSSNNIEFGGTGSVPNWAIGANGNDLIIQDVATNLGDVIFDSEKVGIRNTSPQYTLDVNGTGRFIGQLIVPSFPTFPNSAASRSYVDNLSSLQGLQSVLDTGREWTSSNGLYEFSLLRANDDMVGGITYNNSNIGWGYNLNAEEGLNFTISSGNPGSTYSVSNGYRIKGSSINARYTDTNTSGYVYIQETFGNAFDVANRRIWDNPGGQGIQTTFSSNAPGGTLHWQYQNDFAWSVNDNEEVLRIKGDVNGTGKVGIKITNPQRELDVNGGIRVRGPLDLFQQNNNSFVGTNVGNYSNVVGNSNSAFGEEALAEIETASRNTAVGFKSLNENTIGNNNTSVGEKALQHLTVGSFNTAVGNIALKNVIDGQGNTAIGQAALPNQTTGDFNTSVGRESGKDLTTGFRNTFIGFNAGGGVTDGQRNIYIGNEATIGQNTTNAIVIGASQSELGSNTTVIGNSDITETLIHGNISFEQHGGTNVRALIGTTSTSPNCDIEIGQTGTSIIEGINLKPGDAGGIVDIYNNTSVAARFKSARLVIGDLLDVSKTMDKTLDIQDNDPFIRLENSIARKLDFWVEPNSTASYIATSGGNDELNLSTGGSDRIHIANDGSIGIGTTNPGSILEIVEPTNKAELKLKVSSDEDTAISFENPNRIFKAGYDTSKDVFKIAVSSFNSKNFTIAPGGNCGIGTDTPSRDLHISSSTAAIELENTSQSDCFINFKNPGRTFKVGYDDSSDVWKVAKSTFGDNALTVNGDDGRVGLGTQTTDPSAILELDSDEQGFLMPRLTTTEINAISSPATGLAVYNTSLNTICFYNGTTWQKVSHANM